MQTKLQRIEIEAVPGRDHDLAVDHAAGRQPFEQGFMQFGKVAIERLQIAALDVDVVVRSKHDRPKPVPLGFEEHAVRVGDVVDELREHRLDGGLHQANRLTGQQANREVPVPLDSHILTIKMRRGLAGRRFADPDATNRFFQQALDAVRQVPGVTAAATTTQLPLTGDSDVYGLHFESGAADGVSEDGSAFRYAVSPGYFDAMRIPLRRGRLLSDQDRAGAPLAVVISEAFATQRFRETDPIGQRVHIGPTNRPWFTIVGVVGDVKQMSLESNLFFGVYVTPEQWHFADRARWVVVKAQGDAAALAPAIQSAIWSIDKDQAIVRVAPLSHWVEATAGTRRFAMVLFEAFGFAALLLTAIGIYGVVSGGVNERVREIGVRTALGASRGNILSMVMGQGLCLSIAGVAIGLALAALASRGLQSLLFGISPLDPASFAAVAAILMAVAAAASWLPAWRASRVDPSITLRSE